jgi:hypothetical protein
MPEEPAGTDIEIASVPSPQERATNLVESEELLVADPRGSLTPAQMVDQKLLALLGSCPRSLEPGNRQAERRTAVLEHFEANYDRGESSQCAPGEPGAGVMS